MTQTEEDLQSDRRPDVLVVFELDVPAHLASPASHRHRVGVVPDAAAVLDKLAGMAYLAQQAAAPARSWV